MSQYPQSQFGQPSPYAPGGGPQAPAGGPQQPANAPQYGGAPSNGTYGGPGQVGVGTNYGSGPSAPPQGPGYAPGQPPSVQPLSGTGSHVSGYGDPSQWMQAPQGGVRLLGAIVTVVGAILAVVAQFLPFMSLEGEAFSMQEFRDLSVMYDGNSMTVEAILLWVGPAVTVLGVVIALITRRSPKVGVFIAGVGVMIMGFSGAYWPMMILPDGAIGSWLLLVAFLISLAGLVRLAYHRN